MKKSVSPVVAVALLLVTTVVAAVGFQGWYNSYSSSILGNVEDSGFNNRILVQSLIGDNLYLKSDAAQYLQTFKIFDSNGTEMCSFEDGSDDLGSNATRLLFNFDNGGHNLSHVLDASSNSLLGLINGSAQVSNDCISGTCFSFDGDQDNLVISNTSTLDIIGDMSLSFWVYLLSDDVNRFVWDNQEGSNDGWQIYFNTVNRLSTRVDSGDFDTINTDINVTTTGNWDHYVVVMDSKNNSALIYKNGQHLVERAISVAYGFSGDTDIYVGSNTDGDGSMNGSLDEMAIYARALTSQEVNALYTLRQAKFYEQIIPDGIKVMNISSCNLTRGERYDIFGISNKYTMQESIVKR